MNLTGMVVKFRNGGMFTDEELLDFHNQLKEVYDILHLKGDMFVPTSYLTLTIKHRVEDIITARGLK